VPSEILDCTTSDLHPLSLVFAEELASAARELQRMQRLLAQALAPIRHERAMGRTRDRILGDAAPGAKNRDTKSQSFPGANAITANVSSNAMA
jgi:hypothetical protein